MPWYLALGGKHPHAQQVFLLSLPLRNLNVISEGHWVFFQIILSFSYKIMGLFENVCNAIFTFYRYNSQARYYLLYRHILSMQYLENVVQNTIGDIYGVF